MEIVALIFSPEYVNILVHKDGISATLYTTDRYISVS